EERQKAEGRSGTRTDLGASLQQGGRTNEILAKKVGMSSRNIAYLLAVYRNRLDLFELVFDGSYSINKAYTQMKADEEPKEESKDPTPADALKRDIERMIEDDSTQPQYDESEHELSPRN